MLHVSSTLRAYDLGYPPNLGRRGIERNMPELPEFETINEDLRELVVGSRIKRAEVLYLFLQGRALWLQGRLS